MILHKLPSKQLIVVGLCLSLPGCSWLFGDDGYFRDRKNDYLEERVLPPLELPEGVQTSSDDELFVIPVVRNRDLPEEDFEAPRPTPLASSGNLVKIQKLSDDLWLLIDVPPSHLWQRVKDFLTDNRIPLVAENAEQGLLETSWLSRVDEEEPQHRERYRYVIDQGVQRNSSEVHIIQYQVGANAELAMGEWPAESISAEREEWMVRELAQYLADVDTLGSVSLLAQGIGSASKVTLARDDSGRPRIILELPYPRAWASVGQALEKASFNVADLDRSKGLYYVSYQPELDAEEPGFFGKMFGGGKRSRADEEDYLLTVKDDPEGVAIQISGLEGDAVDNKKARDLLERLKGYLS